MTVAERRVKIAIPARQDFADPLLRLVVQCPPQHTPCLLSTSRPRRRSDVSLNGTQIKPSRNKRRIADSAIKVPSMEDQIGKRSQRQSPQPLLSKQNYLLAYNGISLLLWGIVTLRTVFLIPTLVAHDKLFGLLEALQSLLAFTQTLALLEVVHSVVGLVRASPITTAMQVSSRILLVWGILARYPQIIAKVNSWGRNEAGTPTGQYALTGLLLAWGITECIRYGYFVYTLGLGRVPSWLTWLRYNTFYVLYPQGISSECWLIYLSLDPAAKKEPMYNMFLKVVLLIYIPGSYILYTHMMSQRKRVLKGKGKVN